MGGTGECGVFLFLFYTDAYMYVYIVSQSPSKRAIAEHGNNNNVRIERMYRREKNVPTARASLFFFFNTRTTTRLGITCSRENKQHYGRRVDIIIHFVGARADLAPSFVKQQARGDFSFRTLTSIYLFRR